MFEDHQNLLSTFGKDSQSSNRNSRKIQFPLKTKKLPFDIDYEPKSKYQQILSQRRTSKILKQRDIASSINVKTRQTGKKIKTQNDIDYLNTRIRKSITGITQTICLSKIKSHTNEKRLQIKATHSSKQQKSTIESQENTQYKHLDSFDSRKKLRQDRNKQNLDVNAFQLSKKDQKNLNRNQYLKNSTKKKINYFQNKVYPIKNSFSINSSSASSSNLHMSRKQSKKTTQFNEIDRFFAEKNQIKHKQTKFYKHNDNIKIQQMEQTLKKSFRKQIYQKQIQPLKPQQKQIQQLKPQYKRNDNFQSQREKFEFYPSNLQQIQINTKFESKNKHFNNNISKRGPLKQSINKVYIKNQIQQKQQKHQLIKCFQDQIQLDYSLRHAKHMFSGIQQPFNLKFQDNNLSDQNTKWQLLNNQLQKLGLNYSIGKIKKLFLPSQEQIDPFLSAPQPHQQLIYSLIYAYQTAEIHWEEKLFQKWQHWHLRDIEMTIENVDSQRKGYITVEDLAAYLSVQTMREYKNRDVYLIYKRLLNLNNQANINQHSDYNHYNYQNTQKQHKLLKFRSVIDSLIQPFGRKKHNCYAKY